MQSLSTKEIERVSGARMTGPVGPAALRSLQKTVELRVPGFEKPKPTTTPF